jgi:hypothetical protein
MDVMGDQEPKTTKETSEAVKNKNYWTLEKVGTAIALGAFLFGFGSFAQAKDFFTGETQRKLAQQAQQRAAAEQQQQWDESRRRAAILRYVESADAACQPTVSQDSNEPAQFDYQAELRISGLRLEMLTRWESVPWGPLPGDQIPEVRRIWSEFQAANDYWAAMTSYRGAGNIGAQDAALGLFTSAEGAFEADADRFGFRACNHRWPNLEPS